ncbi:MAG: hypothetical protein QNI98_05465 [Woeseiaceae bacterium]|nr:hypothetical protein [Woeseiaceae bacterium]
MSSGTEGRLTQWLEIIAAVGVILSLLFVGFEIRQNYGFASAESLNTPQFEWRAGFDSEFADFLDAMRGATPG